MANRLLAVEDWKRIYETFQQVDLASYDFENLRRIFLDYVKNYYPEDFNDFIESSEYVALLDLIAFLGQNVSFRTDLNARENFIDTALRRDSIIRLSRMLGYNTKRNIAASGLLKISQVVSSEDIFDRLGNNLKGQPIFWNDPANPDFFEQFVAVLSSSMLSTQTFNRPLRRGVVQGISTEEYQINTTLGQIPVVSFTDSAGSAPSTFEVVSSTFEGENFIYEQSPTPGLPMTILYRNDGKGYGSPNNGFFVLFKQGNLSYSDFTISDPLPNQLVGIDVSGINNDDVWLFQVNANGFIDNEWTKIPSAVGTNVVYNSLVRSNRNVYSVITRENDQIDVNFSDGNFGNLPRGSFRCYYRSSIGQSFVLRPTNFGPVNVNLEYISKRGEFNSLTLGLSLTTTVSNASPRESLLSVKSNAPQLFYTQNRMVSGEDYNIFPLTASQNVIRCKAINRFASGTNRYIDIIDPTGRYSSSTVFGTDGVLYKESFLKVLNKSFPTNPSILEYIRNVIEPLLKTVEVLQFYYVNYPTISELDLNLQWIREPDSTDVNTYRGFFRQQGTVSGAKSIGELASGDFQRVTTGAIVKFKAPEGKYFYNGKLVIGQVLPEGGTTYIYAKIVNVVGDGSNSGRGLLSNGRGPVILNEQIPSDALVEKVIPVFSSNISASIETSMLEQITTFKTFGIGYDDDNLNWYLITDRNLNRGNVFSLEDAKDTGSTFADASWLIKFEYGNGQYTITYRGLEYYFESQNDVRFYYDNEQRFYNNGRILTDIISVLRINGDPNNDNLPYVNNVEFQGYEIPTESDGFPDNARIKVNAIDTDFDLMSDNLQVFEDVVSPTASTLIYFEKYEDIEGFMRFRVIADQTLVRKFTTLSSIGSLNQYDEGQIFYVSNTDKFYVLTSSQLIESDGYKARIGRKNLNFKYVHSVPNTRRIDPSVTNLIDIYVMTKNYDTEFRNWLYLNRVPDLIPLPPTDQALRQELKTLENVKSLTDEIVYHPVEYKVLLGEFADDNLKGKLKVVKSAKTLVSDNEIKSRIVAVVQEFFALGKFDIGETFYFTELAAYIHGRLPTLVSSVLLVPILSSNAFGDLFQVRALGNEVLIADVTVDDIEIVSSINNTTLISG
jgi:hypothetical protein